MCTVVLLSRPGHPWPVLLAGNRDETLSRPWQPPGEYWPDLPDVIAPRDLTAGGTWMAMNRAGVVATVLNRSGMLGPAPGKRSRGELPLLAVEHDSAVAAAASIVALDAAAWRGFNMVIADRHGGIFVRGLGSGRPEQVSLGAGVHMVTAHEPNDEVSPRVVRHLPRFRACLPEGPGELALWEALLADRGGEPGEQLNVVPRGGFGTASSSLVALPAAGGQPLWLFAAGPPDAAPFTPLSLPAAVAA